MTAWRKLDTALIEGFDSDPFDVWKRERPGAGAVTRYLIEVSDDESGAQTALSQLGLTATEHYKRSGYRFWTASEVRGLRAPLGPVGTESRVRPAKPIRIVSGADQLMKGHVDLPGLSTLLEKIGVKRLGKK